MLLFGLHVQLCAQIIKVDKDWIESDSIKDWQGIMSVNVDNIKNTIAIFQMTGDVQISHNWKNDMVLSVSNLRLLYEEKEPLENAGFQHIRYIKTIDSTFSLEGFTQIQFDQLLKINTRWVTGIGLRYTIFDREKSKLYLRPGYMFEYEEEDSTGIIHNHHRLSNYITLRLKSSNRIKFYFTIFYQPRTGDFSDFRLSPAWAIEINIIKNLTFNISGDVRYDSSPVAGVNKTTYMLTNGLGWRF